MQKNRLQLALDKVNLSVCRRLVSELGWLLSINTRQKHFPRYMEYLAQFLYGHWHKVLKSEEQPWSCLKWDILVSFLSLPVSDPSSIPVWPVLLMERGQGMPDSPAAVIISLLNLGAKLQRDLFRSLRWDLPAGVLRWWQRKGLWSCQEVAWLWSRPGGRRGWAMGSLQVPGDHGWQASSNMRICRVCGSLPLCPDNPLG